MMKRLVTAAVAAIGLCFLGQGASAEIASKGAVTNPKSTFSLIRYGGGGGHWHGGMGHIGGGHPHFFAGPRHGFIGGPRHGFVGHRFAFHRRHFHGGPGFFFYGGPFLYDDGYYGGSCYWNCRQFHGPRYCSLYAYDYCD